MMGISDYNSITVYAQENGLSVNRACISLLHSALKASSIKGVRESSLGWTVTDPLIATYRGGNGELFHHWYPLLEGFSPCFVRTVLETYAPRASKVLDPFGGTGAAPLAAARYGSVGLFCELNPALQFVTQVKAQAMQLGERGRQRLIGGLREEAFVLALRLGTCAPDPALASAYITVFKESQFFDEATLQDVLRLRTLADDLEARWPLLGQVFAVAVLSSLVPGSLMKRAGDLRYKTHSELARGTVLMRQEVARKLEEMARDIETTESISGRVILLSEDARALRNLPCLDVDCVITSPPYINGTNYFRNTKIELWFLRALRGETDLRFWRSRAVTAGINDVTKAKCEKPYPKEVARVVHELAIAAYDARIPMMVGSYFLEMREVLGALTKHLLPGALVAVDIGDSRYGGIHVETDRLLADIGATLGYKQMAGHTLRLRKSRDGGVLTESLLVFEYQRSTLTGTAKEPRADESTSQAWKVFKTELPHQVYPYRKRNWGHPLHSLCSYQGKIKPSLAHFLVSIFVPGEGRLLDPFAGVGTIPFEACLDGKIAFAFEISPAALAITQAKMGRPDRLKVGNILASLEDYIRSGSVTEREHAQATAINFNRRLDEFYHPETFREILLARTFFKKFRKDTVEWSYALACLLHILHGNRPYALSRRSHPITPFAPTGPFEYRPLLDRMWAKIERGLEVDYPTEFRPGHAFMQDATLWWPREVEDLDAVITSPPFFDSTRFYLANWIRLWFCGWEKPDFAIQPLRFLELKQKESMRVYESLFRQARERLKPNGIVVLHLGKSSKCDMARVLIEVAQPWFKAEDLVEESVTHTESHGITDKGEVTGHQYLILR